MRTVGYIIILSIACGCNLKKDLPSNVSIDVLFYPSFHLPLELEIFKKNERGYLVCKVFAYDSLDKIISFDSIILTKRDFTTFFEFLDTVSLIDIPSDTANVGADGITFDVTIQEDENKHKFSSWSPTRKEKPIHYKFLDAVFNLANDKLEHQSKYIKDVQHYFSYEPETSKANLPLNIKDVVLEDITPPISGKEKQDFLEGFVRAAKSVDSRIVRKFVFDSLLVFNKSMSANKFLQKGFKQILDDTLLKK